MSEQSLTMGVAEAAAKLDVSVQWLRIESAAGRVPSRKIGRYRRFTEQDLTDYLEKCRQGADDPFAQSAASNSRRRRSA